MLSPGVSEATVVGGGDAGPEIRIENTRINLAYDMDVSILKKKRIGWFQNKDYHRFRICTTYIHRDRFLAHICQMRMCSHKNTYNPDMAKGTYLYRNHLFRK